MVIDASHLVALSGLAVTATAAIVSRIAFERGVEKRAIFRWNMAALVVVVAVFLPANVALVARVANGD